MGIKELPSIKAEDVARQSSKLACNVIVGSRLRGYLHVIFIKKQSSCLLLEGAELLC